MNNFAALAVPDKLLCRSSLAWQLILAVTCLFAADHALAQPASTEAEQYRRIAIEREQAQAEFEQRQWQCSKRFVVTSCVNAARVDRRNAIDALNREEAALDSARRQAKADQRLAIIKQKTEAFEKLRPIAQEPQSTSHTLAAEQAPSKPKKAAAPVRDAAAADAAAAQRAQASQRRRAEAVQRQLERESRKSSQKSPASSLPARPPIPPAQAASAAPK